MSKRIIISEQEKNEILNQHNVYKKMLNEQVDEHSKIKAIQKFLNEKMKAGLTVDGKTGTGSNTAKAISNYQSSIGVIPADGVWGEETTNKMPPADKKRLEDLKYQEEDFLGKISTTVTNMFK
jgi:hypothetical protein